MILSENDLNQLSQYAILAAQKAGALIQSFTANAETLKSINVQQKIAGNTQASQIVSEVDFACEKLILDTLKPTFNQYDLGLLTEERQDDGSRFVKDYFWCIDPLDGTLAFTQSKSGYAVSIALVSKSGDSIIGVVYDPVTQTLYSAIKGKGVLRSEKKRSLESTLSDNLLLDGSLKRNSSISPFENAILTLASDNSFSSHHFVKSIISEFGFSEMQSLPQGGAVMNACWVLENSPAIYFKLSKSEEGGGSIWDFAATNLFFSELKLVVSDANGDPLQLNPQGSTFMNLRGVVFSTDQNLAASIIRFNSISA